MCILLSVIQRLTALQCIQCSVFNQHVHCTQLFKKHYVNYYFIVDYNYLQSVSTWRINWAHKTFQWNRCNKCAACFLNLNKFLFFLTLPTIGEDSPCSNQGKLNRKLNLLHDTASTSSLHLQWGAAVASHWFIEYICRAGWWQLFLIKLFSFLLPRKKLHQQPIAQQRNKCMWLMQVCEKLSWRKVTPLHILTNDRPAIGATCVGDHEPRPSSQQVQTKTDLLRAWVCSIMLASTFLQLSNRPAPVLLLDFTSTNNSLCCFFSHYWYEKKPKRYKTQVTYLNAKYMMPISTV